MDISRREWLEKAVFGDCSDTFRNDEKKSKPQLKKKKQRAWEDEEEQHLRVPEKLKRDAFSQDSYADILQKKFVGYMGTPTWCKSVSKRPKSDRTSAVDSEETSGVEEDDDGDTSSSDDVDTTNDEILGRCGNMIGKSSSLKPGTLSFYRAHDLTREAHTNRLITALEFHPTSTVALVAGLSGIVSIVQVDGIQNSKLQNVHFSQFPIHCAHFACSGEQFVVGSKKNCFYYYDMMTGKSVHVPLHHQIDQTNTSNFYVSPDEKLIVVVGKGGHMYILNARTKEYITTMKANATVNTVAFNNNGSRMYTHGVEGNVYEWDMKHLSCIQKVYDNCVNGTSISMSPNNQLLATGSTSGVVNIHQMPLNSNSSPCKYIYNLVTAVNSMHFNHTSEILAIASKYKENAVKLVHFPTMSVYSNFPGFSSKLSKPQIMDFSPMSGFFAIANEQNKVFLYRLKHFKNY